MTYQERGSGHEVPEQDVEAELHEFFKPDAAQIVTVLGNNPLCIVTGPYGIGKSTLLIPEIEKLLTQQGRDVIKIPGGVTANSPEELPYFFEEIPNPTKGVAIVDEAGAYRTEEARVHLLRASKAHGFQTVIPVIAYDIDHAEIEEETAAWQRAGELVNGVAQKFPTVHMPIKELSVDLARKFLVTRGTFFNTPPEAIDYILQTVPRTIRVLDQVSGGRSLQTTQAAILANCLNWDGAFPRTQVRQIESRVRFDIGHMAK